MKTVRKAVYVLAVMPTVLIALSVTVHYGSDLLSRWYWRRGKRVPRAVREAEVTALRVWTRGYAR